MLFLKSKTTQLVVTATMAPFLMIFSFNPKIFWLTRIIVTLLVGLLFRYVNFHSKKNFSKTAFSSGFSKLGFFLFEFIYLSGFVYLVSIVVPEFHHENIFYMLMTTICAICILGAYPFHFLVNDTPGGADVKNKEENK